MRRLVIFSALLLAACEPKEPHWRYFCRASHTESRMVYWPNDGGAGTLGLTPAGAGMHMGGGVHLVQETVCDRRDSTWVVPEVKP